MRQANDIQRAPRSGHREAGVSLVVVLILLVAMSILGLAVMRSSGMQERMSANMRDRSLAFQAAETALRVAQEDVLGNPAIEDLQYGRTLTELGITCAGDGICDATAVPAPAAVWLTAPDGRSTYRIEYLGTGNGAKLPGVCQTTPATYECERPMFRITARGRSPGLSEVFLQANVVSR
ncbi:MULTISPECIES: PilX N-terminal domain-containing pilus assembly protein [unclassified Pseudoxanthomonas]|uniref:pilus assembly PilX family protein n=1 Tax=unclassified Pseudoxanthomonas TaxID=2645906 RepID=UPI00307EA881